MAMSFRLLILDRYLLGQILGTMCSVLAVVISLMILEHLPRLLEITSQSGHRGYIVAHTVAGLLPEYGGIGLPVGLFLGVALTIRKLALRGELDVIEACGISPLRWMRFPLTLAAIVSILTILNQGWLMPSGEIKLAEIGKRMADGEFGHQLQTGQFINLGSGSVLLFEQVDSANGDLIGLFLRTEGNIFTAKRGRFWQLPSGATGIELRDGQVVQERDARVVDFAHFQYRVGEVEAAPRKEPKGEFIRRADIGLLWATAPLPAVRPSMDDAFGQCSYYLYRYWA